MVEVTFSCQKIGPDRAVVYGPVIFCATAPFICGSGPPEVAKSPLTFYASQPVETHAHPFHSLRLDGVCYHSLTDY